MVQGENQMCALRLLTKGERAQGRHRAVLKAMRIGSKDHEN